MGTVARIAVAAIAFLLAAGVAAHAEDQAPTFVFDREYRNVRVGHPTTFAVVASGSPAPTLPMVPRRTVDNAPPTVSAGADVTIALPATAVTLSGSASDSDGSITRLRLEPSGRAERGDDSAGSPTTVIDGLGEGSYDFRAGTTCASSSTRTTAARS